MVIRPTVRQVATRFNLLHIRRVCPVDSLLTATAQASYYSLQYVEQSADTQGSHDTAHDKRPARIPLKTVFGLKFKTKLKD